MSADLESRITAAWEDRANVTPQSADVREAVEAALIGKKPTRDVFAAAAEALLKDTRGFGSNDFKIPLTRRTLIACLAELTGE